jgi:hypothetical protein
MVSASHLDGPCSLFHEHGDTGPRRYAQLARAAKLIPAPRLTATPGGELSRGCRDPMLQRMQRYVRTVLLQARGCPVPEPRRQPPSFSAYANL